MKKRLFALGIAAVMASGLLAGCSSNNAPADGGAPAEEETAGDDGAQAEGESGQADGIGYDKLVMGLDDTFAPMGFRDENGELTGVDVELATAVSEKLGIEIEFQPIDWSTKEIELNNNNIDIIWNGYTITDERKEQVLFTDAYLDNRQIVVTMADSDINTLADLAGKTVAAQSESSAVNAIESMPEIRDTFAELVTLETNDQCLRDLESGRSQAVVADEVLIRYYISQKNQDDYRILDEDFGDEEYGIGVRKGDEALANAINEAFAELKADGTLKEIGEKWFGADIIQR